MCICHLSPCSLRLCEICKGEPSKFVCFYSFFMQFFLTTFNACILHEIHFGTKLHECVTVTTNFFEYKKNIHFTITITVDNIRVKFICDLYS